jgi:PAS domain S-box-containing protein
MFSEGSYSRLKQTLNVEEGDFVKLWVISAFIILALLATVYSLDIQFDDATPYFIYLFPQLYYIPIVLISIWYPRRGFQATILLVAAFLSINGYFSYLGAGVDPIISTLNAALYVWVIAATTLLAREGGFISSKYRKMFDDAPVGILLAHFSDARIQESNRTLAELLGYEQGELTGRSITDLFADPTQKKGFHDRIQGGYPVVNLGVDLITRSGERRAYLISTKEIVFEKLFECTFVDISDLKSLGSAIGNAREHFMRMVSSSHDLVFLQDLNGTYQQLHWKKGTEYGIDAKALIGKTPYDLLPEDGADSYMGHIQALVKSRRPVECELTVTLNSREFIFSTILAPFYDDTGKVIAIMGSARDVTEVRQEDLARIQLEREIKHRRDFITTAAHELRTPLQPILGYLHLLIEEPEMYALNDETTRILRLCLENVERERRIVDRMLELSILYNGKLQLDVATVSLPPLIDSIIMSGGYDKQATIENTIMDGVAILADGNCMYQVLETLISNAIRYNTPPKKIWITYQGDETSHIISIQDNGIGIDERSLEAIFKPFYLPDGANLSRQTNRLGLGLSIAREYVRLHGGDISVTSAPGEGSTFTIRLPREVPHGP